jgi:hypothetical protein
MKLNAYAAEKRLAIFEDLLAGRAPREGSYDEALLTEAKAKGHPQMGTTRYTPKSLVLEYIYPEAGRSAIIVTVHLPAPERIVYLPVPEWVVETIWQGEISGSYAFESDALDMEDRFRRALQPEENARLFGQDHAPVGRG